MKRLLRDGYNTPSISMGNSLTKSPNSQTLSHTQTHTKTVILLDIFNLFEEFL